MASLTIGLPRALLHYEFGETWRSFLEALGAEPLVSAPTSRREIERGIGAALDETCLPVKAAYGHCLGLCGHVDAIFVPRLISVEKRSFMCPKLLGLPDMIRLALPATTRLLSPTIDLSRGSSRSLLDAARQVGQFTGACRTAVSRAAAILAAGLAPRAGTKARSKGGAQAAADPLAAGSAAGSRPVVASTDSGAGEVPARPCVGLLGHSYNLQDAGLNLALESKLKALGVALRTPEHYAPPDLEAAAGLALQKPLFWTLSRRLVGAARLMAQDGSMRGLIFVASFGCGPDSLVMELVERFSRRARPLLPFMGLVLDEHTGEAGLLTRLEAFTDLIPRPRGRP